MSGQELATGDLIVGNLPGQSGGIRAGVEPHVSSDALAAYLELYSTSAASLADTTVTFEIAEDADGPALATVPGQLRPGAQPTWRAAQALLVSRVLPPGHYVARAQVVRGGRTVSVLTRPFVLEPPPAGASRIVTAAIAPTFSPVPAFDRAAVLQRDFVAGLLDRRRATLAGTEGITRRGACRPLRRRGTRSAHLWRPGCRRIPARTRSVRQGTTERSGDAAAARCRPAPRLLPGRLPARRMLRRRRARP